MEAGSYKLSFEEYLDDPCQEPSLSRGMISLLLDSPAKAWWNHPRLNQDYPKDDKDTAKFDEGSAAHNLLFENGDRIFLIAGHDDYRKNAAKEAREAARTTGMIPLLSKQLDTVTAMIQAAERQIREVSEINITSFAKEGDAELTYIWQEKNGVWCRIRPDWIRKDRKLIVDYKTTGISANPDDFSSHMNRMDYPIQSVFYRRGVHQAEKSNPIFVFIAQENEPPYLCSFHGIDFMNEEMAQEKVNYGIRMWKKCLDSGQWPGYTKRVCYAEPRPWDLAQWEMEKAGIIQFLGDAA